VLITDGLPAYYDAFNKEFYTNTKPQSKHINAIKLDGLKVEDTPILPGYQIFHNLMRPHISLKGKTPAESLRHLCCG